MKLTGMKSKPSPERPCQISPRTPAPLPVPVQDQAFQVIFHAYVLQDPALLSSFNYLPDLLLQESEESALTHAVTSLGIAGLATKRQSPSALAAGNAEYAVALRSVNDALSDRKRAVTDQTLITVMLLGLHEVRSSVFKRLTCKADKQLRQTLV